MLFFRYTNYKIVINLSGVAKQWQSSLSKSAANKEFYSELEKIFKTATKE